MNQTKTSFTQLFGNTGESNCAITRIEIPLIQRDYAQGRESEAVQRIRTDFLNALYEAVMPGSGSLSLDFIYGDQVGDTLYPLDGQQRLTTLFLLHCYLGWRARIDIQQQAWTQFSYATRASARQFCEVLVKAKPPCDGSNLRGWITDQDWYFYGWQHDSTIRAMLVMLDAIAEKFQSASEIECLEAWDRLTDTYQPAINFHLLPIKSSNLTSDLYIKMNSRGKPLTEFENFKAHFEAVLQKAHGEKADEFARNVDTCWADILWIYRDNFNLIDDRFLRYFRFVCDLCNWRDRKSSLEKGAIGLLAEQVFGEDNPSAAANLDFLFAAFETWKDVSVSRTFSLLFKASQDGDPQALLLFNPLSEDTGEGKTVDLFGACCRLYGTSEWTLSHTLLLSAVLFHRIEHTKDFPHQIRVVRNLIEASDNRRPQMQELLADVRSIVVNGTLESVTAFNAMQRVDEIRKASYLQAHPELYIALHDLEDHSMLHGCLAVFELEPTAGTSILVQRAAAFHTLFDTMDHLLDITGALLAIGDYSRKTPRWAGYSFCDFGSSKQSKPWRRLFTGKPEKHLSDVVMSLLDQVAENHHDLACLQHIQQDFITACEKSNRLDWRCYLVKYPVMRSGKSGRYSIHSNGYSICMLHKLQMNSHYHDPYLTALYHTSVPGSSELNFWYYGYETEARRMQIEGSVVSIQSVDLGWQLSDLPTDPAQKDNFDKVCAELGIGADHLFRVNRSQCLDGEVGDVESESAPVPIDHVDRIELGAKLVIALRAAGL
jgi:hypothetical protein